MAGPSRVKEWNLLGMIWFHQLLQFRQLSCSPKEAELKRKKSNRKETAQMLRQQWFQSLFWYQQYGISIHWSWSQTWSYWCFGGLEGLDVRDLMFPSLLLWTVPPHFWNVWKHDIKPEETSVLCAGVASSVQRGPLEGFRKEKGWEKETLSVVFTH